MTKRYLLFVTLLIFAFAIFSPVLAENTTSNAPANTGAIQLETRVRANGDSKSVYESQKATLETQRERTRAEIEVRKTQAEANGNDIQANREMVRLELQARRAETDAKREVARVKAEAKRVEMQAKRVGFQQDIAKRKVEHTSRVVLVTIERLEGIIVRLESRITKVQAQGGIVSESEGFVSLARTDLLNARAAMNAFAGIDLSSEKAAENFERIRTMAAETREQIRAAHRNLMMAVRSLSSVEADLETDDSLEQ